MADIGKNSTESIIFLHKSSCGVQVEAKIKCFLTNVSIRCSLKKLESVGQMFWKHTKMDTPDWFKWFRLRTNTIKKIFEKNTNFKIKPKSLHWVTRIVLRETKIERSLFSDLGGKNYWKRIDLNLPTSQLKSVNLGYNVQSSDITQYFVHFIGSDHYCSHKLLPCKSKSIRLRYDTNIRIKIENSD